MAYDSSKLRITDYGGVTGAGSDAVSAVAHYVHTDAKATIVGAGYFNADWQYLPKGTIIHVASAIGGTPVGFSLIVTASSASGVTVAKFDNS